MTWHSIQSKHSCSLVAKDKIPSKIASSAFHQQVSMQPLDFGSKHNCAHFWSFSNSTIRHLHLHDAVSAQMFILLLLLFISNCVNVLQEEMLKKCARLRTLFLEHKSVLNQYSYSIFAVCFSCSSSLSSRDTGRRS